MIPDNSFSGVKALRSLSIPISGFFARGFAAVLFFAVIAMFCSAAQAATITVNGLGDTLSNNGVCTIREAIINANNDAATWADCAAGSGTDTIVLPAGTITLTIPNSPSQFAAEDSSVTGDLDITSSININGAAAGTVIDGGAHIDRIFDINPDVDQDPITPRPVIIVHINTLTMTNGYQNQSGAVRIAENATVNIDNCTISNSTSWADDGGGVYVFTGGILNMTNCTVSGNHALLLAGGIKNEGTMTMMSCLVTGSTSSFTNLVTGVLNQGVLTIGNTIIAGNAGVDNPNLAGATISLGYNIIGSLGTNAFDPIPIHGPGDQVGASDAAVQLGPLQNNVGPTATHALGAGSIAIDQGNSFTLTTDQRGQIRPCDQAAITNAVGGDGADVGPFEVQGSCSTGSPPDAVDDSATVAEDSGANTINVLANDSDPDMDTLTITAVTQGAHGSVAIGGGGTNVTYTPNANYFGPDSFTYTIDDGHSHTDTATVNVMVTNVEDPPDAVDDSTMIAEDSGANSIYVLANDTDVDGDSLTVTAVTQGLHGSVANNSSSVSYTPNPNYFGPDTFTYTISDGHGGTDTATVHVTVTNVNDPPVAVGDSYSTNSNTPLNVPPPGVLGNDSDVDGDALTAQLVSGPSHAATFALNGNGSFSYTPTFNYAGPDSFTYKAFDGAAFSNTVTVNINVIDTVPPTLSASVAKSTLWPPNHDLENVGLSVTASDNSGGPVTTQVVVFSDEDDLAPDSGNFSPDARNIAPGTLRLRSERSGGGDGRVYLIVVTATDSSNNVSRVCLTVVVPQSQSQSAQNSVNSQAAAAKSYCETHNGAPPPGYFVVGDGPVVGPKQ